MKKLFSNPLFLHFFYISAIALSWYAAWNIFPNPRTQTVLKDAKAQLIDANEMSESLSWQLMNELKEQTKAYGNRPNMIIQQRADSALLLYVTLLSKIAKKKENITQKSIETIKKDILQYDETITSFIEKRDYEDVFKKSKLKKMLQNQDFWQSLLTLNENEQQVQFEILKNMLLNQQILLLEFFNKRAGVSYHESWGYMVGIYPNMGVVRVGELFKADAAFVAFIGNPNDFLNMSINDVEMPMKEGVAHFEKRYHKPGKYTIKAKGSVRNPLTNEIKQAIVREFTLEVLPKAESTQQ
jgi:hypothetical protein